MSDYKEPPHKTIKSYGSYPMGPYSTHSRCEKGSDVLGKGIIFEKNEPYMPPGVYTRSAYKNPQLKVNLGGGTFNKIEYKPSPYEDKSAKKVPGKKGFCSSKPFGRDDISSMLDTLRYRHSLIQEERIRERFASTHIPTSPMRSDDTLTESVKAERKLGQTGMTVLMPFADTDYDRVRHQKELPSKVPHTVKYERDFGPYRTAAHEIGENCADKDVLHSPSHGRAIGGNYVDNGHLLASTIAGYKAV